MNNSLKWIVALVVTGAITAPGVAHAQAEKPRPRSEAIPDTRPDPQDPPRARRGEPIPRRRANPGPGPSQSFMRRPPANPASFLETFWQRFDKDKDGVVLLQELPEPVARRLAEADRNADGSVDRKELSSSWSDLNQNRPGGGFPGRGMRRPGGPKSSPGPGDKPGRQTRPGSAPNPGMMLEMMLRRLDKDQNGSISVAEAPDRMKDRFGQLDANGDGQLDKAELQSILDRLSPGMGAGKRQRGDSGNSTRPQQPRRPPLPGQDDRKREDDQ